MESVLTQLSSCLALNNHHRPLYRSRTIITIHKTIIAGHRTATGQQWTAAEQSFQQQDSFANTRCTRLIFTQTHRQMVFTRTDGEPSHEQTTSLHTTTGLHTTSISLHQNKLSQFTEVHSGQFQVYCSTVLDTDPRSLHRQMINADIQSTKFIQKCYSTCDETSFRCTELI